MTNDKKNRPEILDALEKVAEILPIPIAWLDKDSVVVGVNSHGLKTIDCSREDYVGKSLFDIYPYESALHIKEHDELVIASGKSMEQEESVVNISSGEPMHFVAVKSPLRNENNDVFGLVVTAVDITAKKEAENALIISQENEAQLRHAVTILAGSVAHDLRTPIASINFFAKRLSQLLQGNIPAEAQTILQCLSNITADMNQSIDGTLQALSDAVKGVVDQAHLVPCDINQCLNHVLEHYPFEADEASLISWNNTYSFSFNGNKINFYRVLFNLIKNSLHQIKEQHRGEIMITTEATADCNLLKFKDTVGGLAPEMIKDIFSGFDTTKQGGTGVGLAFCQLAMQNIGGDIDCQIVDCDCIEFVLKFPGVAA